MLVFWCFVAAQNESIIGNTTSWDKQVQVGMTMPDQTRLSNINIGFCNDGLENITKNGVLNIRPWQVKEICMVFGNSSTEENISIVATFVDTELTKQGNLACSLGINTGKSLASHISFDEEAYRFTLAPGQTIIRKAKIQIPQDVELWVYKGCVGYQLDIQRKDDDTWVFFVIRRKVGLMEIMVDGDVYKFWWLDNVKYIYQNNKVVILKWIAWIIGLLLIYYIFVAIKWKKPNKHPKKK